MRVWSMGLAIMALAISASATIAQDVEASWKNPPIPSEEDYPSLAVILSIAGEASVSCMSSEEGVPEDCKVAWESPTGLGFGERAVQIVERGRLNPATSNGSAIRSEIDVTVPFLIAPLRHPYGKPSSATSPVSPEALAVARVVVKKTMGPLLSRTFFNSEFDAPADRQAMIEDWFREESPSPTQVEQMLATILANYLSIDDLEALAQGRTLSKPMNNWKQMEEDIFELMDGNSVSVRLRTRYCARFDCEIIRPSPAG
ncbi:MAG: TonB family protein [Pseudomonadota bacterium]